MRFRPKTGREGGAQIEINLSQPSNPLDQSGTSNPASFVSRPASEVSTKRQTFAKNKIQKNFVHARQSAIWPRNRFHYPCNSRPLMLLVSAQLQYASSSKRALQMEKPAGAPIIRAVLFVCLAQSAMSGSADAVHGKCTLGSEDIPSLLDSEARTWDLNDSSLKTYGLHPILDCALTNDTIRMRAEATIRPEATIRIERGITIEGVSVDSTKITCTPDRILFRITEAVDVSLRNFTVEGCRISKEADAKSIITSSGSCFPSDPQPLGSLEVTGVVIQRNANEGGGVVPHFDHPTCFSLKLERVEFISNVIDGSSLLASVNNLTDVAVRGNVVEHQAQNVFFNLPRKSYSIAERLSAVRNNGSILRGSQNALTLLNSEFRFNRLLDGRLLYFLRSDITMNGVLFESNSCDTELGCIFLKKGRTADLHSVSFLSNSLRNSFFAIEDQSNINLTSCIFDSNNLKTSDAYPPVVSFTFYRKSWFFLKYIIARNNVSPGSIFHINGYDYSNMTIEGSLFEGNRDSSYGTMYVRGVNHVDISSVHFIDNQSDGSGGLYLDYCSNVRVDSSSFIRNNATDYGGGLRLTNCESVKCASSVFEGNSAHAGGGSAVESLSIEVLAKFENCKFINNTARTVGGALALLDERGYSHLKGELKDTVFQSNHAQIAGGGIYVDEAVTLATDCRLNKEYSRENMSLLKPVRSASGLQECRWFEGNTVGKRGSGNDQAGAVRDYYFFLVKKPLITEGFEDDSAEKPNREYYQPRRKGNGEADIWTLAADGPTATERNESHRMKFGDALVIENWRPGDPLPVFEVFFVDRYGQSPAAVEVYYHPYFLNPELRASVGLGTGSGRFILQRGTPISTKNAGIHEVWDYSATPGESSFTVEIEDFSNTSKVNITFRECIINEEFPGGNLCKDCLAHAYNFNPKNEAASCSECPENLDCSTRFVLPQNEYWNSFPCSVQAQRCINPDACRYRPNGAKIDLTDRRDCNFNETEIELYWEDQCVEGHKGRLCAECKDGYGSAGAYTCGACRSPVLAIALSLIAFAVVFGVSLVQIGSVIELKTVAKALFRVQSLPDVDDSGQPEVERCEVLEDGVNSSRRARASSGEDLNAERIKSKIRFAEILKSGINFVQTMTAAASMDVSWTETLRELFRVQRWIGGDAVEATSFSTECLLSGDARTLVRQIVVAVIPLLVVLIQSSYFLKSFAFGQIDGSTFLKRCALILIVVFYVCYASLARTAFALLYCVNITVATSLEDDSSPEKFWAVDTSKECFEGSHLVVVLAVALPILVLTFFPIFVAVSTIFVRSRKKLGSESALDTLGLLYRGFNEETVYWDSLILLRKALIVGILTFGYNLGGTLQGQACVCVLVIALYLQMFFRPFRVGLGNLNSIESLSLLVSILTFVGGVAIDDPGLQSTTADYILISLIVASNSGFILFICHQLFMSKCEELKFSLLESGVDVEGKSLMFILKAWIVLSFCFGKKIETKTRNEAITAEDGEVTAPGA